MYFFLVICTQAYVCPTPRTFQASPTPLLSSCVLASVATSATYMKCRIASLSHCNWVFSFVGYRDKLPDISACPLQKMTTCTPLSLGDEISIELQIGRASCRERV